MPAQKRGYCRPPITGFLRPPSRAQRWLLFGNQNSVRRKRMSNGPTWPCSRAFSNSRTCRASSPQPVGRIHWSNISAPLSGPESIEFSVGWKLREGDTNALPESLASRDARNVHEDNFADVWSESRSKREALGRAWGRPAEWCPSLTHRPKTVSTAKGGGGFHWVRDQVQPGGEKSPSDDNTQQIFVPFSVCSHPALPPFW